MPLRPIGVLAVKLAQFEHGSSVVPLVAVGVAQVIANGSLLGGKTLGAEILDDGFLELVLFVQNQRQVGVGLPVSRVQINGLAIGGDGGGQVSIGVESDA